MKRTLMIIAVLFAVAGCAPDRPELPSEPQTLVGILRSAGISRSRRGTHELLQGGRVVYYVESKTIDLRAFEEFEVTVVGVLESNSDPGSPPVLVARDVNVVADSADTPWVLTDLSVRFSAPVTWRGHERSGGMQFFLTGASLPILTVYAETGEPLLPGAQPVSLQGVRAMRSLDEATGSQTVVVHRGKDSLVFLFTPKDLPAHDADAARQSFLRLLRTIALMGLQSSSTITASAASVSSLSSAGSAMGKPCGGVAGILCPQGFYCAITDVQNNVGTCMAMRVK
jgi:hypothetical protein